MRAWRAKSPCAPTKRHAAMTTRTDLDGKFAFGNLANGGNYTVTTIHSGYAFIPPSAFLDHLTGTNALVFTAVPMASPQLRIAPGPQNPDTLTLAWPVDAWSFLLETTDSLPTPNWTPVTGPRATVGDEFVIEVSTARRARYFRLRRP
jgi:hypothetical protein